MSKLSETSLSENLPARDRLSPEFSLEQRRILLRIARDAIVSALEHRPFSDPPVPTELLDRRGVFTTLYLNRDPATGDDAASVGPRGDSHRELHRELRGCVGYAMPVAPLHRAVAETARAAAFQDSRFLPVAKDEVWQLEISLSVLSRLFPVHPCSVEVGRHGLVISEGARRGLLLPQVPIENGWDQETFLEQTCRKAGLPLDAWRKNAMIEAFTAEVFCDSDLEVPC
jgi:AmmeMemoRadiSam system protein A